LARLWAAAALVFSGAGSVCADSDTLGRLFFTPAQRTALERQRHAKSEQAQIAVDTAVTINGVVRRSGGKNTVWINGVPHSDSQATTEGPARIAIHDPSRVSVKQGQKPPVQLRVGESFNAATQTTTDSPDQSPRPGEPGAPAARNAP
jgi:hypothetical protein